MKKLMTLKALVTLVLISVFTTMSAQEIKKKRGRVKLRHPNGVVMAKGKVRNHKMQGEWKFWDDKGVLSQKAEFRNDTLNGLYTRYSEDGSVFEQGRFHMGKKTGEWALYFTNGAKATSSNYIEDQMDGEQKSWFANGNVREVAVMDKGTMQSRKAWYSNGRLRSAETYIDGKPHGTWVTYADAILLTDTLPETIDDYDHGKREGRHILYVGAVKVEEFYYSNDLLNGECRRWSKNGDQESIEQFENGLLQGICKYYKDGILLRTVQYSKGTKNGEELDYDRNERKLQSTWYTIGEIDSVIGWFPNGRMATRKINASRQSGQNINSNYTEWDSSGVKLQDGNYSGLQRSGKWTTYYPNGIVRSITNYEGNRVNGLFTKWYPNGKKMIEMHVFESGLNTPPDVWDEKGKVIRMGSKAYNEIVEGNKPGEIFNDASSYHRPIIDRRVEDAVPEETYEVIDPEWSMIDEPASAVQDTNMVYDYPEISPLFPGGDTAMINLIAHTIQYPSIAKENERQGTVYVKFIVEKNGAVSNVTVVRDVKGAPELSAEAVRVVRLFPVFVPGKNNGRAVRSSMIIPIKFSLK